MQERNAKLNAINSNNNNTQTKTKEPECWGMCPEFEMIDRQVTNDVSLFEAQIPFNPPHGKLIIDPKRAVKKFRRSAAGNYELAEDLRPPEVLLATTVYLMRDVLGDGKWPENNVPFAVLYAFIRDRLRAIRTDLTLQNCKTIQSIRIHELSIRFLIAAGHLLCEEERAAFEPQQNNEQLNGCLSALREMYKAVRLTGECEKSALLKYEAEFQAYSIILSVDKKEAALAISSLPLNLLQSESIQVALEAFSSFQNTNYVKFLGLIRDDPRTTYLQACLMHQFVLPVRQKALTALVLDKSNSSFKTVPKADIIRWLAFVDEAELLYYADRFGFRVAQQTVDLTSLIQRGEAQDLRAEEENFKVRQFHESIEQKRRKGVSLSEIMFEDIDLNLEQVMKVLNRPAQQSQHQAFGNLSNSLTSEFLAAASSPKPTRKKFYTSACVVNDEEAINNKPFTSFTQTTQNTLSPAVEEPKIDLQSVLKKKLEAQAQERQARKERIDAISLAMLDALIDSIVGNHVAESCTNSWDYLSKELRQKRKSTIEQVSLLIYENLIETEILPSVLDIELMKLRCRAAESLEAKIQSINQATFSILNSLEQEIYQELILESFLNFKSLQFTKQKWFKLMRNRGKSIELEWQKLFNIHKDRPIHLLFIGESFDTFLEPLIKAGPPNTLKYLQSFITNPDDLKILWSTTTTHENPFILSHSHNSSCIDNWPSNFPGPTVIVTTTEPSYNTNVFPWTPKILNLDSSVSFKDIISTVLADAESPDLPIINENLKPSDFIPEELIESFVIEPFEKHGHGQSAELLKDLFRGFFDRLIWILFRSPQSSKLLSWHPKIAGKSRTIESIRKSQSMAETFLNLFSASNSIQMSLDSLDQIYENVFVTGSLDCLYTTQSISDFVRNQNEIINRHCKRVRSDYSEVDEIERPRDKGKVDIESNTNNSLQVLKEKLKNEATESSAYEEFLKKFL